MGGDSCFVKGTTVRMSNGTDKNIEDVKIGDKLLGQDGNVNTVLNYDHWPLGGRDLIGINGSGPFKTPEHPLMTKDGWKAYNSQDTIEQKPQIAHLMTNGNLEVGDEIQDIDGNWVMVESLEVHNNEEEQQVYNFMLDGNHTYYANGLLAHNRDPLAQTFMIFDTKQSSKDETGFFLTSVDIYYFAKDSVYPTWIEIRNVINGVPGPKILPFGRKLLQSDEVLLSNDGSVATTFTFDSPVYVKGGTEYCVVVRTDVPDYKVWISDLGTTDANGNEIQINLMSVYSLKRE